MKNLFTLVFILCISLLGHAQISYIEDTSANLQGGNEGSVAIADTNCDGIADKFTYTGAEPAFASFAPVLVGGEKINNNTSLVDGNLPFTPGHFDTQAYADFDNNGTLEHLRFFGDGHYRTPTNNPTEAQVELIEKLSDGSYLQHTNHGLPGMGLGKVLVGHYDGDTLLDVFISGSILDVDDLDNDGDTTDRTRFAAWYRNNGDFSFTEMQTFVGTTGTAGAVGNIDDAHYDDIIYSGFAGGTRRMFYLQNNGAGFTVIELGASDGFFPVGAGDIAFGYENADDRVDYIAITGNAFSGFSAQLKKDTGSGLFAMDLAAPYLGMERPSVAFTDADGDGLLDLYVQGRYYTSALEFEEQADVFRNTDGVHFEHAQSLTGMANGFATEIQLNDTDQPALLVSGVTGFAVHTILYLNHSTTLTVNEHVLDNDIRLYPNPTRDVLNISLADAQELAQVQIFDISGRQVASATQSKVNVHHLSAGIYIARLHTASGEQGTKKFVKK